MTADDLGCQRNDRDTSYLTDIWYGTGRTWVYLDDIYVISVYDKLDIDHSLYMKSLSQLLGVLYNGVDIMLCNILRRIYRDTVSGMDTGTLNMLHDTRDQNVSSITDGIYFDLFTHNIFIYQDRMLLSNLVDNTDKFINIFVTDRDLHALSAQYIGRTYQNRISQLVGSLLCLFCCKYSMSRRSRNMALFQDLIKTLSVLCSVYIFCCCTKDRHTHFHKCFCQLNRSLSAELYHCAVRLFNIYNTLYIFWC